MRGRKTVGARNILRNLPGARRAEIFTALLDHRNVRIERIVSRGQSTPKGKWLRQEKAEWVVLLQGEAGLRFEKRKSVIRMKPGDSVVITPKIRHRVEWTDGRRQSVWLAVHFSIGEDNGRYV